MLNRHVDNLILLPDITVYMNCDTRFAINLGLFNISEFDEFIFTIKNFSYAESSYAYLYKATKADIDDNGEVILNIDPDTAKNIRQGAFYNFSLLVNANNPHEPATYRKLTENGRVILEYGAHDLAIAAPEDPPAPFNDILGARLEAVMDTSSNTKVCGTIMRVELEECTGDAEV
jgi:hypothetical protein